MLKYYYNHKILNLYKEESLLKTHIPLLYLNLLNQVRESLGNWHILEVSQKVGTVFLRKRFSNFPVLRELVKLEVLTRHTGILDAGAVMSRKALQHLPDPAWVPWAPTTHTLWIGTLWETFPQRLSFPPKASTCHEGNQLDQPQTSNHTNKMPNHDSTNIYHSCDTLTSSKTSPVARGFNSFATDTINICNQRQKTVILDTQYFSL